MPDLAKLENIARKEFADIVTDGYRTGANLRLLLIDGSYIFVVEKWSRLGRSAAGLCSRLKRLT